MERAGIQVVVASSAMEPIRVGQNVQQVDVLLRDADPADYDLLPFGGAPDPYGDIEYLSGEHLRAATNFIDEILRQGKHIATVCNGTAVLAESGCLEVLKAAYVGSLRTVLDRHPEIPWVEGDPAVESSDKILTAAATSRARDLFNERVVALLTN